MDSVDVVFCGKNLKMLVNNIMKRLLLDHVYDILKLRVLDKQSERMGFFGDEFWKHPVLVTVNSKSDNYWLFLTIHDSFPYAVLISKHIRIGYPYPKMFDISEHVHMGDVSFFNNTLFDCELIGDKTLATQVPIVLLFSDILIQGNKDMRCVNPCVRFANVRSILKHIVNSSKQVFLFRVKTVFHKGNLRHLRWFVQRLPYETYGLTFYSCSPTVYEPRVWFDRAQELYSKAEKKTIRG